MAHIHAYLTFNGNCREAMTFYKRCLDAEVTFRTIGESPLSEKMPEQMKNSVLHSVLRKDELILMASDMASDKGLIHGNAMSVMLECDSEEELRSFYGKLAEGGIADHPVSDTFWGSLFGHLTDKFGNQWLLNYTTPLTDKK